MGMPPDPAKNSQGVVYSRVLTSGGRKGGGLVDDVRRYADKMVSPPGSARQMHPWGSEARTLPGHHVPNRLVQTKKHP